MPTAEQQRTLQKEAAADGHQAINHTGDDLIFYYTRFCCVML